MNEQVESTRSKSEQSKSGRKYGIKWMEKVSTYILALSIPFLSFSLSLSLSLTLSLSLSFTRILKDFVQGEPSASH